MMNKFRIIISVLICVTVLFSVRSFSLENDESDKISEKESNSEKYENDSESQQSTADSSCLCGREYFMTDDGEHSKYDCIKCGKNMYACTCDCWCGSSSILDTSGNYGSVSPRICSGCGNPCPECNCRDDKAEILAAEKLRINGDVSPLNLPIPNSGVNLILSFSVILILVFCAYFFSNSGNTVKNSELNLSIPDFFSKIRYSGSDSVGDLISEKKEQKERFFGIFVYEKLNYAWIKASENTIDLNSKIPDMVADNDELFIGERLSAGKIKEKSERSGNTMVSRHFRFSVFSEENSEVEIRENEENLS